MKKEIDKSKASRLVNAGSLILVTAAYKDKDTITTCAWHAPASYKPACLMVALAKKHLSSELITKSKEFIINIPSFQLKDKAVYCGSHSGREVDKFKETGLTRGRPLKVSKAPWVNEALGHVECSLADIKEAGDHFLFLGEPLSAVVEEELFDFENIVWKEEAGLIFHLGGPFFMRQGKLV